MMGVLDLFKRRKPASGGDGHDQALDAQEIRAPETSGTLADIDEALKVELPVEEKEKKRNCGCGCFC